MPQNSATIIVDNKEYQLKADIPADVLNKAVETVNERISKFKNRSKSDELRATIMTALSLAVEFNSGATNTKDLEDKIENLEAELALAKEEVSRISDNITASLQKANTVFKTMK